MINIILEYQNVIIILDNTPNKPSKNLVKIKDDSRRSYNNNSQIKFKTATLKTNLCDYSNACILVKGTLIITGIQDLQYEEQRHKYKQKEKAMKEIKGYYLKIVLNLLIASAKSIT